VLEFLKVTLLICLFFQLFSTAQAADIPLNWRDYIPTQENVLKAEQWVLDHSSREVRLFLHSNLPALFPVNILCQLIDGAAKQSLLPGDEFHTKTDQAELNCKDLLKLKLHKESAGTIDNENGVPKISITAGEAELFTLGKKAFIHFPDFDLRIATSDPSTRFVILQKTNQSLIYCNRGLAEGQLIAPANEHANEKYLGASNCRLIISHGISPKKHYVFSEELFHPADISIASKERNFNIDIEKKFPSGKFTNDSENRTILAVVSAAANASPGNAFLLNLWRSKLAPANCTLYTQASPDSPLATAYQFKLTKGENSPVKLHPDYRKYYLSIVCSQSDGLSISNQISPY
jgi:hypothetical protein